MLTKFKIFEELKRKSPKDFELDVLDNSTNFTKSEIILLKKDDFEINDNVATNDETYCSFKIKKNRINNDSIEYEITIKKDDKVLVHNRFKRDTYQNTNFLDFLLNVCAKYHENLVRDAHKDLDPYDEEDWSNKESLNKGEVEEDDGMQAVRQQDEVRRRRQEIMNNEIEMARRIIEDEREPKIFKKFKKWFGKEKPVEDANAPGMGAFRRHGFRAIDR